MIENSIHQIWVGNNRIPSHIKQYMDGIKELHKDFNYYFWNDDNLPELPENLKKIYDSYEEPAIKADLLRMYVVYKFGGIYLDADFSVAEGLYSNIIPHKEFDGFVVYNDSYKMSALSNSVFGFNKNNELLGYMIDNITHAGQWIGPNWWSQVICKYLGLDIDKSTVEQLIEKLNDINLQVIHWKDIEENCFKHDALASWVPGSIWNEKLKNKDYD
jgi:mannosyltransferase OCH1-like enzyme